jgi:hypothetical protein
MLAALILLLAIPLQLVLLDLARDALAIPLMAVFQVGQGLLQAIPQLPLWALLIVIALFIATGSLAGKHAAARKRSVVKTTYVGPVQVIARWIHQGARGYYFRKRLAHRLGRLAVTALAPHERLTPRQARESLDRLNAPPEVRAYLLAGLGPEFAEIPRPANLLTRLRDLLKMSARNAPLDLDPDEVVRFLEHQLEAHYDDDEHR